MITLWGGRTLYPDTQRAGHLRAGIPQPRGAERGGQARCVHLKPRVAGGKERAS